MSFNQWDLKSIGEIGDVITGKTPSTKNEKNFGDMCYFITPRDMTGQKKIDFTERKLSPDGIESVKKQFIKGPAICVSCIGSDMGKVVICENDFVTNQQINTISNIKGNYDIDFLYYSLKPMKDYLHGIAGGSTMPIVNKSTFETIKISVPTLNQQKAIAKVLSDLDEKIETNNKINKKLEEMAQAIFKQWFVDFEFPNEDGKPYKSSGGEMVESELGMIPKGWNIKKLSELADMKNGVNYGRNQEGEKVKVVNVRDFDGSLVVNDKKLDSVFLLQKQINDYRLQKYDTVIVRSAKPGETLLVNDDNLKVYSGFTIRIRPKDYNIKLYVFYCIRNSIRQLENSSNGTIFKNLNQQLLGKVSVIEPKIEVINKYNDFIKTIIDKIYIVNEEINRLTDLRDTLLPKLMSGEIRVPVEN